MDRTRILTDMKAEAITGFTYYQGYIQKLIDSYLLRMDSEQFEWLEKRGKSRLYIPKMNSKGKRIADSLTETYFNNDTFAKLGEYINTDEKIVKKWQAAIDHYTEMLNLYKTFNPIFLKAPFLPLSTVKVYWQDGLAQIDEVAIDDIYFDNKAESADDVRYIVNRVRMTKGDIKAMQKSGAFNKKVNIDQLINETLPYERFEVYEIYYREDNKWYVSSIYEDSVILRDRVELKDGQPFVWGYMLPQVKDINDSTFVSAYGEAPLASMLPLQEELNTTRNQMIDAIKQHLAPKLILPKTAGISRLDIETPSKPIFTNQPAAVGQLPLPNIGSAQNNIAMIDQEASEVTGVSPQNNGIAPQRKETATQASIMANEGSVRIQGYIRTFNETFFEPIFERLAKLVWFYGDDSFFMGIERNELPSFKVSLNTGVGALNKEVQKQGLIEAYQMIGQQTQTHMALQDIEGAKRMAVASDKIMREMLPLFGLKDVENYLGKEEDVNTRPNNAPEFSGENATQQQNERLIPQPSIR